MEIKKRKRFFKPYQLINCKFAKIMWDFKPVTVVNSSGVITETPLATWKEYQFNNIPSLSEIKKVILDSYNKEIDEHILTGFTWNNMKIWLSKENQFNYKTAYDLAIQTNGNMLPITFKFGDDENVTYYEFKTVKELTDFYLASVNFIQETLKNGWKKKDSIDWSFYGI
jgi:hypothetical protein